MKKYLCILLSILLCFSIATVLASDSFNVKNAEQAAAIPYAVADNDVTEEMRTARVDILAEYPGLELLDPANIDESIPVIALDSLEALDHLMSGVSSVSRYREDHSARFWGNNYPEN